MDVSPTIVDQRVRNRQIETLELILAFPNCATDLNDIVNWWNDWVPEATDPSENFPAPTYTAAERRALIDVDVATEAFCVATPNPIGDCDAIELAEWHALVNAAKCAHRILMRRGLMDEEAEEVFASSAGYA